MEQNKQKTVVQWADTTLDDFIMRQRIIALPQPLPPQYEEDLIAYCTFLGQYLPSSLFERMEERISEAYSVLRSSFLQPSSQPDITSYKYHSQHALQDIPEDVALQSRIAHLTTILLPHIKQQQQYQKVKNPLGIGLTTNFTFTMEGNEKKYLPAIKEITRETKGAIRHGLIKRIQKEGLDNVDVTKAIAELYRSFFPNAHRFRIFDADHYTDPDDDVIETLQNPDTSPYCDAVKLLTERYLATKIQQSFMKTLYTKPT